MPRTTKHPDLSSRLVEDRLSRAPQCECRHTDGAGAQRCPDAAEVRVTVVCSAQGCTCAAAVYLLCRACLRSWQRSARADGVTLRVRSL